ncbi:MAG: carboxypeptidase regulatory-like domain-containing protein, partial [Solirubrobacteraceae bacterium]
TRSALARMRAARARARAGTPASSAFGALGDTSLEPALEEAPASITGTVTDALSGEALGEVCVLAFQTEYLSGFGYAMSESDGEYSIGGELPEGSYEVEFYPCEGGRYAPQWYQAVSTRGQALRVTVRNGQTSADIDAALSRSATISGKVLDGATGAGVEGVCVSAFSTDEGAGGSRAVTGPEGDYSLDTYLSADSYRVEFDPSCDGSNATSYLLQFYDGASSERSASTVSVAAAGSTTGIDASLQRSAIISGRVTTAAAGEGLGGVCVTASSTDGGPGHGTAVTLADGSYTISAGLYSDTYDVHFDPSCERSGSSPYLSQYYRAAERASAASALAVSAGQTSGGIDASVHESAKISGTVTDAASGEPVTGVCVTATPAGTGAGIGSARTGGEGSYTISSGLSSGSYVVEFDPSCAHQYSPSYAGQFYNGASSPASATLVSASTEASTSGIDAALQAPGTIAGTVTEAADGSPLSGICVDAAALDGASGYEQASTEANGGYSIAGLPAGSYKLEFDPGCGGSSAYATQLYGEEHGSTATPVAVSAGLTTDANAALTASGTISGTVTSDGSAVEGVCVDVASSTAPGSRWTTTAGDGTYSVAGLPAGSYTVEFDPGCAGFRDTAELPQFFEDAAAVGQAKSVNVAAGATAEAVDGHLQPAGQISGRVTDAASGSALEGVCVTATSSDADGGFAAATTAGDGTYTVQGLAPGAYEVEFDPTCNGASQPSDAAQFYAGAESQESAIPVAVSSGTDTPSIDAALRQPGEITGEVTDAATGAPIGGVCVEIVSSDGGPGSGFATTAGDGAYSVPELPADSYIVEFEPACQGTQESGYESRRYAGSVALAPGQTRTGIDTGLSKSNSSARLETSTSLKLSTHEVTYGREQVAHITVSTFAANRSEPTGSVKVSAGQKTICKITLSLSTGSCTPSAKKLKAGSYSLVATYKGSKRFARSTSPPAALLVKP